MNSPTIVRKFFPKAVRGALQRRRDRRDRQHAARYIKMAKKMLADPMVDENEAKIAVFAGTRSSVVHEMLERLAAVQDGPMCAAEVDRIFAEGRAAGKEQAQ